MTYRNPHKTLARQLESALLASRDTKTRVALHLTREEWALVIEALRQTGASYALREKAVATEEMREG